MRETTLKLRRCFIAAAIICLTVSASGHADTQWRGLFSIGPSYNLPSGDFFYKTEGGPGFGSDIFVGVGQNSFVGARVTRLGVDWDEDDLKRGAFWPSNIVKIEAWSVVLAYRYERELLSGAGGRFRGAVDAGMGTIIRTRGSVKYPNDSPQSGFSLERGNNKSMAVIHMGGELIAKVWRNYGVAFEFAADNGILTRLIQPLIRIQNRDRDDQPLELGSVMHLGLRLLVYVR